ncbi:MAG TPA: hypothetical protein VN612_10490 [Acidobacteriaceae bacterium]|nr:hypothetical protein [Acidobacteriaceae bacterium]
MTNEAWPAALAIGALVGLLALYGFAAFPSWDRWIDRALERIAWRLDRFVDMAYYRRLVIEEWLREKLS